MTRILAVGWGPGQLRAAVLEDGEVIDLRLERDSAASLVGARFLGRVRTLLPGTDGAFVELGPDQLGFLPRRGKAGSVPTQGMALAVRVVKDARDGKPPELALLTEAVLDKAGPVPRRLDPPKAVSDRLLDTVDLESLDRVIVNEAGLLGALRRVLRDIRPQLAEACVLEAGGDLLERLGIEAAFATALAPVVPLATGGAITIEETAAGIMIDVDLGEAAHGREAMERAILAANLAAAREVARQARWRNLGGAITIDFITLRRRDHRDEVMEALAAALADDPTGAQIHGWTRLGRVEVTRRRQRPSLPEIMLAGPQREATAVSHALLALERIAFAAVRPGPVVLHVSAEIGRELKGPLSPYLALAEQRCGRSIKVEITTADLSAPLSIDGI